MNDLEEKATFPIALTAGVSPKVDDAKVQLNQSGLGYQTLRCNQGSFVFIQFKEADFPGTENDHFYLKRGRVVSQISFLSILSKIYH